MILSVVVTNGLSGDCTRSVARLLERFGADRSEHTEVGCRVRLLTGTKTVYERVVAGMAQTVDELRNAIRIAVGRFEREGSSAFTKEDLAAVCDAVGYEIDTSGRLPPKADMRAGILWKVGVVEAATPEDAPSSFRKGELEAIAAAVQ